ncbi:hypothetical protein VTK56DRAFT_7973 [Thermocarpiscus australiensis]
MTALYTVAGSTPSFCGFPRLHHSRTSMALSDIWLELPRELVGQILDHHVDDYFGNDPAYTWVQLRHVSAHQKHAIERRFEEFWLPKLNVTVYEGSSSWMDYILEDTPDSPNPTADGRVIFFLDPECSGDPKTAWAAYKPTTHRNVTVRLGEAYLSGGCRGGYIVNDTDLPGLEVLDDGRRIRFCWKDAVNELLREELYMRRVGDEMGCT